MQRNNSENAFQAARGGFPSDQAAWQALKLDSESPLIRQLHETEPVTYAYRARYLGRRLTFGPCGDPATCTVSV